MNIKNHIEAGHYPKDDKGRALVPMRNGNVATIYAADAPGAHCIVGNDGDSTETWDVDGRFTTDPNKESGLDLMPPTGAIAIRMWATVISGTRQILQTYDTAAEAARHCTSTEAVVELIVVVVGDEEFMEAL